MGSVQLKVGQKLVCLYGEVRPHTKPIRYPTMLQPLIADRVEHG